MAFLKIQSGNDKGRKIQIDRDEIVVGRASENVARIDDPSVSGRHCSITRQGRRFTLRDLASTNGTRLNGVRIDSYQLSAKDIISAGTIDILFDGDDIDDLVEMVIPPTIVRPTPGRAAASPTAEALPFEERSSSRSTWIALSITAGILVLAALAWFLFNLLESG